MNTPLVSVCVMTHNHERYISDCLMSAIAQSNDVALEILVGDDNSTDETSAIVQALVGRFPDLIRYFRHDTQLGGENYQFLIAQARGEYIAHLDGDDFWLPGKLRAQVKFMQDNPDCSAVCTNALCVNPDGRSIGVFNNAQSSEKFDRNALLKRGNFLNNSALLYQAKFASLICGWQLPFIDYKIALYLAGCGKIGYIDHYFACYRVNSEGSMIARANDWVREQYWRAMREILFLESARKVRASATADFLSRVFYRALSTRNYLLFFRWWKIVTNDVQLNIPLLIFVMMLTTIQRGALILIDKFCGKLSGNSLRVHYRR